MKHILIAVILLISSVVSFGQKEIQLALRGDTLIVPYYPLYKYLKIGQRVYKIEDPVLKEVDVPFASGIWFNPKVATLRSLQYDSACNKSLIEGSPILVTGRSCERSFVDSVRFIKKTGKTKPRHVK